MKSRSLLLSSLIVATSALSACGGGGGGNDSLSSGNGAAACSLIGANPKVIGGTTCTDTIKASVVRLANPDAQGRAQVFCTGTVIAPRTVLTAGHCVIAFTANTAVIAGDPDAPEFARIKDGSSAPGLTESDGRLFNDATILYLDRDISSPAMPVLVSRSAIVGEPGYVYGYGRTIVGDGENPEQGIELQGGTMTVRDVTPNHIFVRFDGDVNVCNGDSGGPLVIAVNGQPAVAGVVSEGSVDGCAKGDVTTFTNLQSPAVLKWLGGAAPNASLR